MNFSYGLATMTIRILSCLWLCVAGAGHAVPPAEKSATEGCALKFNIQIAIATGIIPQSDPVSAVFSTSTQLTKARQQLSSGLNRAALQTLRNASSSSALSVGDALEVASLLSLAEASVGRPDGFEKASRQAALLVVASDPQYTAGPLINLGAAFLQSGQLSVALAHFDRAAAVAKKLPDRSLEAMAEINAALVATRLDKSDALARALVAKSVVQTLPPSREQAQLLARVARALTQMNATTATEQQRLEAYASASSLADIAVRQRDQLLLADALGLLGEVYYRSGQFNDAEVMLRRAVAVSRSQADYEYLHRWLWLSGRVAKAKGDEVSAYLNYEAAVAALVTIRARRVIAPAVIDATESVNQVFYDFASLFG